MRTINGVGGEAMKYDLLTVGFPIVEIMRKERGVSFEEPADFTGPYPSGDTCIVLDVASRLGNRGHRRIFRRGVKPAGAGWD